MKIAVVLLALVVTVASQSVVLNPSYGRSDAPKYEPAVGGPNVHATDRTPGLRVKFGVGSRPGTDFFFDVPRTLSKALKAGWSLTPRPEGPLPSLSLYCHSDLVICVLFDDTRNVAGLQLALDQSKFVDNLYDMTITGFKEWVVTDSSGQVRKFWAIAMYFVSEDYLKLPACEREGQRNSSKFLQEDAVWLTGFNGVIDKISVEDSEIQKSVFTKQACIPWMGRHYYHKMTKDIECRSDTMYPWFLTTDSNKLTVLGLSVVGKYSASTGSREWFEHPSRQVASTVIPYAPECLYDMATTPGITTMHVYLINRPWSIACPIF